MFDDWMRTACHADSATMKQASLFDDADGGTALPTLGVPGSKPALSKTQKLFNKLIDRIASRRRLLQEWRDFVPVYQQRFVAEIAPLNDRLRQGTRLRPSPRHPHPCPCLGERALACLDRSQALRRC